MILSSVIMGLIGIIATFLPKEILIVLGQTPTQILSVVIQIIGALYFGFAFLNWMAKSVLIGGIYSRPLCIGNFAHFLIGGLALLKFILKSRLENYYLICLMIVYLLFAVAYGVVFQRTPKIVTKKKS